MDVLRAIMCGVFGFYVLITFVLRCNERKYKKKGLPPGTMGWPFFGETADFLKHGPTFMKKQRARYGSVFKTHILGCPTIISMDQELNKYILMNEGKGIIPGYPQTMVDILGKSNIASVHGVDHKNMRGAFHQLVSPNILKQQVIPKIDGFMRTHLSDWTNQVIDIQEKTKQMAFLSSLIQIAGNELTRLSMEFMAEFVKMVSGVISLPINLPNTNYHRGLQARKKIVTILNQVIQDRRNSTTTHEDLLSLLMNGVENRYKLSDTDIIDQIITVLYSGYETISTTSMMAVKYLHDHPIVLEELRKEHVEIRRWKTPDEPLDWDDFKSMKFTRAVIFETSRLASVVNGVLRKTTKDMELNGHIIPKGWRIYVYSRESKYDPFLYPDPHTFDPWKWLDGTLEARNYSFMFGGGTRQCPGKELGIIEISTFLHYFVTKYRYWEEVGENKITKFPRVEAPNGLNIRVFTD